MPSPRDLTGDQLALKLNAAAEDLARHAGEPVPGPAPWPGLTLAELAQLLRVAADRVAGVDAADPARVDVTGIVNLGEADEWVDLLGTALEATGRAVFVAPNAILKAAGAALTVALVTLAELGRGATFEAQRDPATDLVTVTLTRRLRAVPA